MTRRTGDLFALSTIAALLLAGLLPLGSDGGLSLLQRPLALAMALAIVLCCASAAIVRAAVTPLFLVAFALCAGICLLLLRDPDIAGQARAGFWILLIVNLWLSAACAIALSDLELAPGPLRITRDILVPALFGIALILGVEIVLRGAGVPPVLLPAPSSVAVRFVHILPMLGEDFVQTFIRGVLAGYLLGNLLGLLTAILVQGSPFVGRGLLPLGNFMSSLPIVGIAPIMVMWFGFDWPSKAAVVAIVTYFPMLTNAVAGLSSTARMDVDLMHSYGASFRQRLWKLQLPAALPFIFNALKINSTLALIGAIIAEFFGTPIRGMGFRISIEAARMSMDVVWAEILLAALVGTAFYGCLVLVERALTFWHPSQRA
jgi:NitT/TauT family transport system permease protein